MYTTGIYDLSPVSNAENLIQDADRVIYTLTLWQRGSNGGYEQVTEDLSRYIRSVRMHNIPVSYNDGCQWTDGELSTLDSESGKRFLLPIRVEVNTDVETNGVTFANYQLRLTAVLCKESEELDRPVNAEIQKDGRTEYIRYDYVTYTFTRILTEGCWGS